MTLKDFIDTFKEKDNGIITQFVLFEMRDNKATDTTIMFTKECSHMVEEKYKNREILNFGIFNVSNKDKSLDKMDLDSFGKIDIVTMIIILK